MAMSAVEPNSSAKAKDISLNYEYGLYVCTNYAQTQAESGTTPVFAKVAKGFDNIAETINEVLYQSSFISDGGWGSSYVTGAQIIVTLSGVRVKGDNAQDYIFGDNTYMGLGKDRETYVKLISPDGTSIQCPAVLAKITKTGGAANQPMAISVEIHFNGKPIIAPPASPAQGG